MGFIGYIQRHFRSTESSELFVECRNCGTSLEPDDSACPCCDGQNFARFDL